MQHKLLGSTALVSAGFLMVSAPAAQAQIEITLSGFTEFGALAGTDNTLTDGDGDRGYDFFMDNEFHVLAQGLTDTGITYGSRLEIEVGSGANVGGNPDVFVDEAVLFFSGAFGRFELGRDDGAEDVMFLGGRAAQSGTGGFDGDVPNAPAAIGVADSGDVAKISYFTPRVAGFQLGASYTPDTGDNGGRDADPGQFEDVVSAGANWVGAFAGFDVGLSAVGVLGEAEVGAVDRVDFGVGGTFGFAGLNLAATYARRTDATGIEDAAGVEATGADIYNVGLQYGFGPVSASVGYAHVDPDGLSSQNVYFVSADVGLMPGVVLKGDVAYNDEDYDVGTDTWGGVVTIQLNY